jgi:hypothetical protein
MKFILGSDSLTVYVGSMPYTINKQAEIFEQALDAVRQDSEETFLSLVQVKKTVVEAFEGHPDVQIINGNLVCNGREVTGLVATRVLEMKSLKLDIQPMLNFVSNLMQNPSKRAVDETFGFVDACNLPLTEDGCILAYKRVRNDFKDCHSGTIDNSVGAAVEMPRNLVDEDKARTCSQGLHFCSWEYLKSFTGERVVVLKINPKDIVAIPEDYNNSKGRCCSYTVVDEIPLESLLDDATSSRTALPIKQLDASYARAIDSEVGTAGMNSRKAFELRAMLQAGESLRYVAKHFGISRRQAARIRDNEAWKA